MEIEGPVKVGVVEPSPEGNYELHISFTDAFKALEPAAQGDSMRAYVHGLAGAIAQRDDADNNRRGMLIVQQICEQLIDPLAAGEMALNEPLVIEIQRTPGVNLADLLN